MVSSVLEQYRIADFLEWHEKNQLVLNAYFQRGPVWPPAARTYLIDTVLRQLPIPKVFMRTKVDLKTKRSIREVVDGQQRLRAVLDFASDRLVLGPRAGEYRGLRYSTLGEEDQERFLSYSIAVEQLINATDNDVLEVFARLNSYTVPVNPPELRHAKYQGEFKWAVHEASAKWTVLWDDLRVLSARDRVRLLTDSLMAEMYGIVMFGVTDGGQKRIDALYQQMETNEFDRATVDAKVDETLRLLLDTSQGILVNSSVSGAPHFLMLFAAYAHILHGLPPGEIPPDPLPSRHEIVNEDELFANLERIDDILNLDEPPKRDPTLRFWRASKSSTQRIGSRRVRFPVYVSALTGVNFDV